MHSSGSNESIEPLGRVEDYFKISKILLSLIGVWPYQPQKQHRFIRSIVVCVTICNLLPRLAGLYTVRNDFDTVIESLSSLGVVGLYVTNLINLITNNEKFKDLLLEIQRDFDNANSPAEITIIQQYGKHSIKLSKIYAITLYTASSFFMLATVPKALISDFMKNPETNVSDSSKKLPLVVDYHVDLEEYFYFIIVHSFISATVCVTILIAGDSIFTICLQHGCAKFMLLQYQLSQIIEPGKLDVDVNCPEIDDLVYKKVKICVHLHNEAIRFASAIESCLTIFQLFQVGICCLLISIIGLHATTKINEPYELPRLFGLLAAVMVHFSIYSWRSHELMQESLNVSEAIYNTEWYRVSLRARKMLLQMMTRSLEECKITAGKLYLMSMENYSKILSNSMSYFTVLSTLQKQLTDAE